MLTRILILILLLQALPTLYIYLAYVRRQTQRPWIRALAFLPTVLLTAYFLLVSRTDDMLAAHQAQVGTFMFVFFLCTIPATLFTLIDAPSLLFRQRKTLRRCWHIAAMTLGFCAAFILIYGYAHGRRCYTVHAQTICFDHLPPRFDGYRIAFFSDLHIGTFAEGNQKDVERLVSLINRQQVDLIAFGGDIVNYDARELAGYEHVLRALQAPDGVVAVMGNHDYPMYIHPLTERQKAEHIAQLGRNEAYYGWRLLRNEHVMLRRGDDSIAVIGVENDGRPPFPSLGDLPKAARGLRNVATRQKTPDHTFSVLLSHDPTHWRRRVLPETNIDLMLSGHTHAGQFKLFGWSPVTPIYDEWSGIYTDGAQVLLVSEGIGQVMFPFRFGAWPEINVITLRRTKNQSR